VSLPSVIIPKDLFDAINRRECVLFLGAGVHYPPAEESGYSYPDDQRPPLGTSFSAELVDECISELDKESKADGPDPSVPDKQRAEIEWKQREESRERKREYLTKNREVLQRTSWYYQQIAHSRKVLIEKITSAVGKNKQPSPLVRALAEIDFPVIITTNYDKLFEKAIQSFPKDLAIRIYDPKGLTPTRDFRGQPNPTTPWFFKMHGCISEPDSIVVTDEDYIHFVMRTGDSEDFHPVPQKLRTQFKEWPTLFVGYSLLDYNLRLLFRTLRRRIDLAELAEAFSLDPRPDLLVLHTYRNEKVSFIEQDSWRFVPELYQQLFGRQMPK
jgi:hypothetical protein